MRPADGTTSQQIATLWNLQPTFRDVSSSFSDMLTIFHRCPRQFGTKTLTIQPLDHRHSPSALSQYNYSYNIQILIISFNYNISWLPVSRQTLNEGEAMEYAL